MRRYQTSLGIKLYSCQPTWLQCKSPDKECRTSRGTSCGGTCYILRQKTLEIQGCYASFVKDNGYIPIFRFDLCRLSRAQLIKYFSSE